MLKRIAEWVVKLEVPILVILAPLLLFPDAKRSVALLGIPLIWIARKIARGRFIRRTPLDWAIALLLLMVLVSLYATFDIAYSLPKIAGILLGVAVFYAMVELDARWSNWLVWGYLAGGLGLAVLAILGTQRLSKLPVVSSIVSRLPLILRGIPGAESGFHPNEVAGALVWFIPLYFALGANAWRDWRQTKKGMGKVIAFGLVGVVTTIVLVFTQSRSAMVGFGLAMLLLIAIAGRAGRIVAAVIMIASVVALAIIGPSQAIDTFMGGRAATDTVSGALDASGRLEVWSRALYGIQDFPFTGMGLNGFRRVVPVLYPLFTVSPDTDIAHAHNHLLQAALDLGLPGLVAYLAIWLVAGAMLFRIWRFCKDGASRALAAGLGAGLLAHFVYGMTDTVALGAKPGVAWWALLGLAASQLLLVERDASVSQSEGT
jgi:putative inorganic carbon (HCO3(-)) transporter